MPTLYTSTFTMGEVGDEFHTLDNVIADAARSIPGYLCEEAWENPSTGLISNVYYGETRGAMAALPNRSRISSSLCLCMRAVRIPIRTAEIL